MNDRERQTANGPRGNPRPADDMEKQVLDALKANGYVDASGIEVRMDAEEGVLTLEGKVDTDEQQRLAEECAASLQGIRIVHNHLIVESSGDEGGGDGSREFGRNADAARRPAETVGVVPSRSESK